MSRNLLLSLAMMGITACGASPKKSNDVVTNPVQTEALPETTDLIKDVEEMPSAEAFEGSDTASSESPQNTPGIDASAAAMINDAMNSANRGDMRAAQAELETILSNASAGYLAAYNLGVIHERQGQYDQSARRYFEALQKNADFSPALINLVRLYLRQNRVPDAERLADRFSNSRPNTLGHRVAALEVGLHKRAYEDVIRKAKEILRRDERNVDAMMAMAHANYNLGRFELARSIIVRAVELDRNRADLYNMYGLVELQLDKKPAAIANFRKAVELRAQYPEARNNLGLLYHEARDYDAARIQFEEAVRAYPDFKEAFMNLGSTYKGLGRFKDAELAFRRAVEIDPKFADGHFNLAILYLDSEVPGMDPIARLQKSVDTFNQYKSVNKQMAKGDPADKYIDEARKAMEVERQKQEMMRESQKGEGT